MKKTLHFSTDCGTLYTVFAYFPTIVQYTIIQEKTAVVNAFLRIGSFFYIFFKIFQKRENIFGQVSAI